MRPKLLLWLKRLLVTSLLGVAIGLGFTFYVAHQLIAPVPRVIGPAPDSLQATTVAFASTSGSTISGWLAESTQPKGAILLLHGVRADRRSMVDRAAFLRAHGYHTLCIDFQAHGESSGEHITMGHLESLDAAAGVSFLQHRYSGLPVAILGSSLGGASALMATYEKPPKAMVIEEVYADVETAVANRLNIKLGPLGHLLSPLLTWQIEPWLGIDVEKLNPAASAAKLTMPVFVLYGQLDRHAKPSEASSIYTALKGPKEIWGVAGAAHINLHRFAGQEYEQRVLKFIDQHLQSPKAD